MMKKEDGSVIGLPLYILIAVVVAAVALAAVLSFMVTSGPSITSWTIQPKIINTTLQPSGQSTWSGPVNITVYDQNGQPMSNVKVVLSGCGITKAGVTDAHGRVTIVLKNVTLQANQRTGSIKVTFSYPGLLGQQQKTTSIPVVLNK